MKGVGLYRRLKVGQSVPQGPSSPGGQQFGGEPIGLEEKEEHSLAVVVCAAHDATDGPGSSGAVRPAPPYRA